MVKSPLRSTAPMASPGAKVFLVMLEGVDADVAPLGTATKPIASRYLPKRSIVSGAKLDIDSGTAMGCAPLSALICFAPNDVAILSNTASGFAVAIAVRNSDALMRGVAAGTADALADPARAILSISSIGVMPQIGSLANCHP